jgi:glucose-1-phosphate thymidylyltransferase
MKGIILSGGHGTRLLPLTKSITKQILPIYNKPMIYYPLSLLMMANIREIMIISTPRDLPMVKSLLGDGKQLGLEFTYCEQPNPEGIAQSFIIAEQFIGNDNVCLVLGDNIFYGHEIEASLKRASEHKEGGLIFGYHVSDPERYGVVEFDQNKRAISIEEKPKIPKSSWAVTGLYFYDQEVCNIAKSLKPSERGELEITEVNQIYLKRNKLEVELLGRGVAWLDTGTFDSLLLASHLVQTLELRQGLKIACIEEIAYNKGYITADQLNKLAFAFGNNDYGKYLQAILNE